MAKLTKADVVHVAKLANLSLTEDEVEKFLKQLSSVVEYVSELESVDTSNIEPTSQTSGLLNVVREDEINVSNILSQNEALSGTDKDKNGLFEVEAILKSRK